MDANKQLVELVTLVGSAVATAAQRLIDEKVGLKLQNAELGVNLEVKKKMITGGKFDLGVSVDLSVSKEWTKRHALIISLTPLKPVTLGRPESEELADAILTLASATSAVLKAGAASFALNSASLSLEIAETAEGKMQVVAGPGGAHGNSHTVKLTFRPS
jgi:hypothetical protein